MNLKDKENEKDIEIITLPDNKLKIFLPPSSIGPAINYLMPRTPNLSIKNNLHEPDRTNFTFSSKLEYLGSGGFSKVYKYRGDLDKKAVKKIIADPKYYSKKLTAEDSIKREIFGMAKVNCENSLKVYGVYQNNEKNNFYILMELCDGNVENYIKDRGYPLNIYETVILLFQLNKAFFLLDINNIIHRDIKPSNILYKEENEGDPHNKRINKKLFGGKKLTFKLGDYGVCIPLYDQNFSKSQFMGTLDFMAPEIYEMKCEKEHPVYTKKIDLFSLGQSILCLMGFIKKATALNKTMVEELRKNCTLFKGNRKEKLLADLIFNHLLIFDVEKRADWQDYFNHPIFEDDNIYNRYENKNHNRENTVRIEKRYIKRNSLDSSKSDIAKKNTLYKYSSTTNKSTKNINKSNDMIKKNNDYIQKSDDNIKKSDDNIKKGNDNIKKSNDNIKKSNDNIKKSNDNIKNNNDNNKNNNDNIKNNNDNIKKINDNNKKSNDNIKKINDNNKKSNNNIKIVNDNINNINSIIINKNNINDIINNKDNNDKVTNKESTDKIIIKENNDKVNNKESNIIINIKEYNDKTNNKDKNLNHDINKKNNINKEEINDKENNNDFRKIKNIKVLNLTNEEKDKNIYVNPININKEKISKISIPFDSSDYKVEKTLTYFNPKIKSLIENNDKNNDKNNEKNNDKNNDKNNNKNNDKNNNEKTIKNYKTKLLNNNDNNKDSKANIKNKIKNIYINNSRYVNKSTNNNNLTISSNKKIMINNNNNKYNKINISNNNNSVNIKNINANHNITNRNKINSNNNSVNINKININNTSINLNRINANNNNNKNSCISVINNTDKISYSEKDLDKTKNNRITAHEKLQPSHLMKNQNKSNIFESRSPIIDNSEKNTTHSSFFSVRNKYKRLNHKDFSNDNHDSQTNKDPDNFEKTSKRNNINISQNFSPKSLYLYDDQKCTCGCMENTGFQRYIEKINNSPKDRPRSRYKYNIRVINNNSPTNRISKSQMKNDGRFSTRTYIATTEIDLKSNDRNDGTDFKNKSYKFNKYYYNLNTNFHRNRNIFNIRVVNNQVEENYKNKINKNNAFYFSKYSRVKHNN